MVANTPQGMKADLEIPRCLADYDILAGELENGVRILLMSSKDVLVSGFGLSVGFGSYDTDRNYPGLPHLLEHMVLLGSKKYPGPHNWQAFVDTHGSATNAATYPRATHYWATVGPDRLFEAADRIIDFVVAPELSPEYLEKTIDVVNSEAEMRYRNDQWRRDDLERLLANPAHPSCVFTIGNTATLKKPGIDEALWKFHSTYYKSKYMSAVAISSLPIHEMYETLQAKLLAIEPSPEAPERPIGSQYGSPEPMYCPNDLNKYIKLIPVSEGTKELSFEFVIDDVRDTYRTLPHWTVTHLLGQEDAGSLTAFFKSKGFAVGLLSGIKNINVGQSRLYVELDLADAKVTSDVIETVGKALFAYIRLCIEKGPPESIIKEKIRSAEIRWDNQSLSHVTDLLANMNLNLTSFPVEEVFVAGSKVLEADLATNRSSVRNLLESLSLDKLLVFASSVDFTSQQDCPKVTEHFNVQYSIEDLSPRWLEEWRKIVTMPWPQLEQQLKEWDLYLPRPNPYIPDTVDVVPIATNVDDFPESIASDPFWIHKLETSFKVPLIEFRALLRFPSMLHNSTFLQGWSRAEKRALVGAYVYALLEAANEDLQCARDANLECGIELTAPHTHRIGETGVEIAISGFSDKAATLLEVVMRHFYEWKVRDEDISVGIQKFADSLRETITQRRPLDDCFPTIYQAWYVDTVRDEDVLGVLESGFDVSKVRQALCCGTDAAELSSEFLRGAQMKCLVVGNVTREEVMTTYLTKEVLGPFYNPNPGSDRLPIVNPVDLLKSEGSLTSSNKLERKKQLAYHLDVAPSESKAQNSAVVIAWQANNMTPFTRAVEGLFRRWLDRIMYDELRTEESLGYVVKAVILPNTGIGLLIQSEKSARDVLDRMLRFVVDRIFGGDATEFVFQPPQLSPKEFDDFRHAVLLDYKQPITNLNTLSAYYRRELVLERGLYDVRQQQIDFLENLTFDDFKVRVAEILHRPWTIVTVESESSGRSDFQYPDWIECEVIKNPSDLLLARIHNPVDLH